MACTHGQSNEGYGLVVNQGMAITCMASKTAGGASHEQNQILSMPGRLAAARRLGSERKSSERHLPTKSTSSNANVNHRCGLYLQICLAVGRHIYGSPKATLCRISKSCDAHTTSTSCMAVEGFQLHWLAPEASHGSPACLGMKLRRGILPWGRMWIRISSSRGHL